MRKRENFTLEEPLLMVKTVKSWLAMSDRVIVHLLASRPPCRSPDAVFISPSPITDEIVCSCSAEALDVSITVITYCNHLLPVKAAGR
jgi:hypothetical protein